MQFVACLQKSTESCLDSRCSGNFGLKNITVRTDADLVEKNTCEVNLEQSNALRSITGHTYFSGKKAVSLSHSGA